MTPLPLVGARFHPPALALLAVLPAGAELMLRPEPSNPHDPNAIGVWVQSTSESLDPSRLAEALAGFGMEPADLLAKPEWMLGYVAREQAAKLALQDPTPAKLGFSARGWPIAKITEEPQ